MKVSVAVINRGVEGGKREGRAWKRSGQVHTFFSLALIE